MPAKASFKKARRSDFTPGLLAIDASKLPNELWKAVFGFCDRDMLREITFYLKFRVQMMNDLVKQAKMLRHFRRCEVRFGTGVTMTDFFYAIAKMPNLKNLSLMSYKKGDNDQWWSPAERFLYPLSAHQKLTTLKWTGAFTWSSLANLVTMLPNLNGLRLFPDDGEPEPSTEGFIAHAPRLVELDFDSLKGGRRSVDLSQYFTLDTLANLRQLQIHDPASIVYPSRVGLALNKLERLALGNPYGQRSTKRKGDRPVRPADFLVLSSLQDVNLADTAMTHDWDLGDTITLFGRQGPPRVTLFVSTQQFDSLNVEPRYSRPTLCEWEIGLPYDATESDAYMLRLDRTAEPGSRVMAQSTTMKFDMPLIPRAAAPSA